MPSRRMIEMGAYWNIIKGFIVSRKISKDALYGFIDAVDVDKDGYVSVKEFLSYVGKALGAYGERAE